MFVFVCVCIFDCTYLCLFYKYIMLHKLYTYHIYHHIIGHMSHMDYGIHIFHMLCVVSASMFAHRIRLRHHRCAALAAFLQFPCSGFLVVRVGTEILALHQQAMAMATNPKWAGRLGSTMGKSGHEK